VVVAEELELLARLDALGDDVELERPGEGDDRLGDRRVVRGGRDLADEGAVDLERVGGEEPERAERRVAGAEVVDRDADAEALQLAELA